MIFTRENNLLIAHIDGAITFSNSDDIKMLIRNHIQKTDRDLILDIKDLVFADSSGVGVFISLLKTVTAMGGAIRIASPNEEMQFVLKMTKIDAIIPLFHSLNEAKASIVEHYLKLQEELKHTTESQG